MKKRAAVALAVMALLVPLMLSADTMLSSGPADGKTGAPGEGLCTECHTSFPVNSGDGSLQIVGLPTPYSPATR